MPKYLQLLASGINVPINEFKIHKVFWNKKLSLKTGNVL